MTLINNFKVLLSHKSLDKVNFSRSTKSMATDLK